MNCLDYIEALEGEQRRIPLALHDLISAFPQMTDKIWYKIPFYGRKSWVCYLNPLKDKGVDLGFVHANHLSNVQGLLGFKGRSQVACVSCFAVSDIREEPLQEVLQEALLIDEERSLLAGNKR